MSFRRAIPKLPESANERQTGCLAVSRVFVTLCGLMLLIAFQAGALQAQTMEARVYVLSVSPPRVRIEGKRATAATVWSFRNTYGSLNGLGERIENLKLADDKGVNVPVRKVSAGEYEAAGRATSWSCEVKLDAPSPTSDSAYASWIAGERGFLMLGDLLPLQVEEKEASKQAALVSFTLPANWNIYASETKMNDGRFAVPDAEDAVFFTGANLREQNARVGQTEISLVTNVTWAFTDQDVMSMSVSILNDYATRVSTLKRPRVALMLAPFPRPVRADEWSAETRGSTVVLLSGQSPSKLAGLAQLSSQLTHELFHFWVPNGLALTGNYDWFYEGFTIYQAMRAAVRLGLLTFQDYLNAVGRAYDSYLSDGTHRSLSLLDASRRRWSGANRFIYRKGLLVAFLYDLKLRQSSRNSHSLDDVYRTLFSQTEARRDGNETVLAILKSQSGMQDFVRRYVESADEIDLQAFLAPFGLIAERAGTGTRIYVDDKLNRRQRDLLSAFGYNEQSQRPRKRAS